MPVKLDIRIIFALDAPFHVSGDRIDLRADKSNVREWRDVQSGRPMVPATSLKGWFRDTAERITRALKPGDCEGSIPSRACGRCLVCELFGSPRRKGRLRFFDGNVPSSASDLRTSVSLSRRRRAAYEQRLFTQEVAVADTLETTVTGWFADRESGLRAAALLLACARAGFALGGSRSRGLGWVRLKTFDANLDGRPVTREDLDKAIREGDPFGHA